MQRPRTLKEICDEELLLSYARLDADFGTDNFARNDDFEAAVFLAAAAVCRRQRAASSRSRWS
jgi:hypothetical protein